MGIVVLKFGGTSVATKEARDMAIQHVLREINLGNKPAVVVSAMGRNGSPYATDTLISLLENADNANPQTLDLLLTCGENISASVFADALSNTLGINAVAICGVTAGIYASRRFGNAEIIGMNDTYIKNLIYEGVVPVISGFQAGTVHGEPVTLGRGGSDTSAVEIGCYLGADRVDIYTDVSGIAIADPRVVSSARYLHNISGDDMLILADWGAKVIHPRAVAAAIRNNVNVRVRSCFDTDEGTLISNNIKAREGLYGIAILRHCLRCDPDDNGAMQVYDAYFHVAQDGHMSIITVVYRSLDDKKIKKTLDNLPIIGCYSGERGAIHILARDTDADEVVVKLCERLDA